MEFTLAILVLFQLARYLINRQRFRSLEERIESLSGSEAAVDAQGQIRELTRRMYHLEKTVAELRAPAEAPRPEVPVRQMEPPPLPKMPPPLPLNLPPKPEPEPEL